jgi:hypothetical protein
MTREVASQNQLELRYPIAAVAADLVKKMTIESHQEC